MEHQSIEEGVLLRYLLGEMGEDEQEQIERSYFTDAALFEELRMVEHDLIDNYVRNGLSALQREQFERHFLCSPERYKRVEVAEILFEFGTRNSAKKGLSLVKEPVVQPTSPRFPSAWLAIAASFLMLIGSAWLLIDRARLKSEITNLTLQRDEMERSQTDLQHQLAERDRVNQQLARDLDKAADTTANEKNDQRGTTDLSTRVAAFVLMSGFSRGEAQSQKLHIAPSVEVLRLRILLVKDDHKKYTAVINDVDGQSPWRGAGLIAASSRSGRTVEFKLPASLLHDRDYVLTLKGVTATGSEDTIDEYPFSILRR